MEQMTLILALMFRLEGLKRTARTGWNLKFPPDHRFKSRTVKDAESVADHTWSLAMFALVIGQALGLDVLKIVWMALIHDVAEIITLDIVTATELDLEQRRLLEADKRQREDAAMRQIFLPLGEWGQRCYELWLEYEDQSSPEARVLRELDKLEGCIQAVLYREQGNDVDPEEFLNHAAGYLERPEFVAMLAKLRRRAAAAPT